jgi:hypothetical protein
MQDSYAVQIVQALQQIAQQLQQIQHSLRLIASRQPH